jgi:hypothetical protein
MLPLTCVRLFTRHQTEFIGIRCMGNGVLITDYSLLIERLKGCIEGLHAMLGS